jgi:hypothetical protein
VPVAFTGLWHNSNMSPRRHIMRHPILAKRALYLLAGVGVWIVFTSALALMQAWRR